MDWPSGLGGVGGRGRFSWVDGSELKILRFFGAGRGGAWSGATEEGQGRGDRGKGVGNPPVGAGQARTERFRGLTVANRRF